ncbi:ATP-dependent nuclease [Paracidovorax citrulli]|uniref:ATP-dependent nuclease n=1 Tax=Paracidovorax citrulli TaxID=80869 RepID=UPI003FA6F689
MYLAKLVVKNFRKIAHAELRFQPGLNVLVGENNVGKTAVVDALRALLAGHDEPYPRLGEEDVHRPLGRPPAGDVVFDYTFSGLDMDDEADFLAALVPGEDGALDARITIRYAEPDKGGRLRASRCCGAHRDIPLTVDMMENLRGVYLPPLRDASQGLKPGRTSQLARLLQLIADEPGIAGINVALKDLDQALKKHLPLVNTHDAINTRHQAMLGPQLAQTLDVGLSASDFRSLKSRLSLMANAFEIDQNGLGFNNLIFMAVVLSELIKNPDACYRGLIVEEPEAHLHPQLQAVLLQYLESIRASAGEKPVQLFVTSHSPNFASIAKLDSLVCLTESGKGIETFFPRDVIFQRGKREKLERYLDVTRAELFFARRLIFVEGAAELMLVSALANRCGVDLRRHGVSLISVEGLNFDSFLPLFGEKALKIPVAFLTDADPVHPQIPQNAAGEKASEHVATTIDKGVESAGQQGDPFTNEVRDVVPDPPSEHGATEAESAFDQGWEEEAEPLYPAPGDVVVVSANTARMKTSEDSYVRVFHGLKTFEYDLALEPANRDPMLEALKTLHPRIAAKLRLAVDVAGDDASKARALFSGMFERTCNNVQKGSFAQALAQVLSDPTVPFTVPIYIQDAIRHVTKSEPGRE